MRSPSGGYAQSRLVQQHKKLARTIPKQRPQARSTFNNENQETWECTPKGSRGRPQTFVCFHCPLVSSAEAKSPACRKEQLWLQTQQFGRAHLARQYASSRMCSLGARLRTRKVTGRDASLPAPLLTVPFELSARKTVGALPQTPAGTLSLHPARGRRKGTKSPLDPFWAARLGRFSLPLG